MTPSKVLEYFYCVPYTSGQSQSEDISWSPTIDSETIIQLKNKKND